MDIHHYTVYDKIVYNNFYQHHKNTQNTENMNKNKIDSPQRTANKHVKKFHFTRKVVTTRIVVL
jgi:hypothetical protein